MTNGEKFLNDYYPNSTITRDSLTGRVFVNEDNADFTLPIEWWDAEYKEPTTKNDKIDCEHTDCNNCVNHKYCDYEPTTKNDLTVDCIDRNSIKYYPGIGGYMYASKGEIDKLPSVTPQEPRKGHCKDCKWWKDSDGEYRRGCGAESICHINTDKVYQGEGYCYMFEPQESEVDNG